MIHIFDTAARKVVELGFTTVGLLGSRYTMTRSYLLPFAAGSWSSGPSC
jgi:aspartate/glutamate racemase